MASRIFPDDGLLAKHEIVRTDNIERMGETLHQVYKGRLVSVEGGDRQFLGQARRVQFERIGFDYCAYDAAVEIDFPEASSLRQQICLAADGETVMDGRRSIRLSGEATSVISEGSKIRTRFGAGYRQLVLRVDPTALRRKFEAFVGAELPGRIEFRSTQTLHNPQLAMLKRMALFFAAEVETFEGENCRLARCEFEEALLATFLIGNAHNYSYLLQASPPGLTPRQIWLAEAFIEAHWDKPLTIDSLAAAVGVGARSIFKSFKTSRGYSPMAFVKDVRLRHAHEMLGAAKPGDDVGSVAFRCGYQNHGHFAREYRVRFGELPSATLAKARRS